MSSGKDAEGNRVAREQCHYEKNGGTVEWNPLASNDDAFQLAVTLRLTVAIRSHEVEIFPEDEDCVCSAPYSLHDDVYAIVRRAITEAAAFINIRGN